MSAKIIEIEYGQTGMIVIDQYTRIKPVAVLKFEVTNIRADITVIRKKASAAYTLATIDSIREYTGMANSQVEQEFLETALYSEEDALSCLAD